MFKDFKSKLIASLSCLAVVAGFVVYPTNIGRKIGGVSVRVEHLENDAGEAKAALLRHEDRLDEMESIVPVVREQLKSMNENLKDLRIDVKTLIQDRNPSS